MIDTRTFENLILTNTIVASFSIVLLITLIVFILLLFVPSIRNRWFNNNERQDHSILSLTHHPSFEKISSRYNPIFEPPMGTTTTQFGTLFHPQSTTATLLHPTIWTSINPTPILSSAPPSTPHRSPATLPRAPHLTSTSPQRSPQRSPKKR